MLEFDSLFAGENVVTGVPATLTRTSWGMKHVDVSSNSDALKKTSTCFSEQRAMFLVLSNRVTDSTTSTPRLRSRMEPFTVSFATALAQATGSPC